MLQTGARGENALFFCLLVERHLLVMSERLSVGLFVYCMQLCGLKMAAV